VHMPSHIYYRVGRYKDALAVNIDAVAADEAYLKATEAPIGVYRLGYYPHNVHFVLATGQMSGDGPTVISAAEKLQGLIPDAAAKMVAFVQPIRQAPYFAHAQFSTPELILALPAPDQELPFVKAAWHYARGAALAKQGDAAGANTEIAAIAAIERSTDFSLLTAAGIPANNVLKIAQHVIEGRIAQAKGDANAAVSAFEKAAALQDTMSYYEPPFWYYPVRQSLGAALVQAKRYDDAAEQFRRSLERAPNNAWSYYGLTELHKARGDAIALARAEELLNQSWVGDRTLLQLSNL
jgi:tetratricopeptide (TPR) repeat protein